MNGVVVEVVGMTVYAVRVGLRDPPKTPQGDSSGERKRRLALREMRPERTIFFIIPYIYITL